MRVFFDTNILINLFVENAPYHKEALELFEKYENIATSSVNIEEVLVVLKKEGIKKEDVLDIADEILENFIVEPVTKEDFRFAKEILKREKLPITFFMDALILSVCKRMGYTLITFDKKLRRLSKKVGIRIIE